MIKNKKSQLKIQQMAFMIIAVFLFFTLVGLFVFNIVFSNLREEANLISEQRAKTGVLSIVESPEFTYGKPNCIDSDKLIVMLNRENYDDFWFFSGLEVIKIRENSSEIIDCDKGNYPNCDRFVVYDKNLENQRKISNFVALCRKELENSYTYDKCEIAKIIVGIEEK